MVAVPNQRTVIACLPPSAFLAFAIWIMLPAITATIVTLWKGAGLHVIGVSVLACWCMFGGFFVSHFRSRVALSLEANELVVVEPGDWQIFGGIFVLRFPREDILSMKLESGLNSRGRRCTSLLVCCSPAVEALPTPLSADSDCSVADRSATGVELRFASEVWKWIDNAEGERAISSWLGRSAGNVE